MRYLFIVLVTLFGNYCLAEPCGEAPQSDPYQIDSSEVGVDKSAPAIPTVLDSGITRFEQDETKVCIIIGTIDLKLTTTDDRTKEDQIGYDLNVLNSSGAPGLAHHTGPVKAKDGWVHFWFYDNPSKPLEFDLGVVAVDLAGNRSEQTASIKLAHPGMDTGGCSTTNYSGSLLLILIGFLLLRRYH